MDARQGHRKGHHTTQKNSNPGQRPVRAGSARPAAKPGTTTPRRQHSNVCELHPKRKAPTKINYGRIALLGILIYFVVWAIYPLGHRMEQGKELNRLKQQLALIEKDNKTLAGQIKYLRSDEYVEQKARTLGLTKPDEEVVVVIPQDSKAEQTGNNPSSQQEGAIEQQTFWQRVTGFFSRTL